MAFVFESNVYLVTPVDGDGLSGVADIGEYQLGGSGYVLEEIMPIKVGNGTRVSAFHHNGSTDERFVLGVFYDTLNGLQRLRLCPNLRGGGSEQCKQNQNTHIRKESMFFHVDLFLLG